MLAIFRLYMKHLTISYIYMCVGIYIFVGWGGCEISFCVCRMGVDRVCDPHPIYKHKMRSRTHPIQQKCKSPTHIYIYLIFKCFMYNLKMANIDGRNMKLYVINSKRTIMDIVVIFIYIYTINFLLLHVTLFYLICYICVYFYQHLFNFQTDSTAPFHIMDLIRLQLFLC